MEPVYLAGQGVFEVPGEKKRVVYYAGRAVSYFVFIIWTIITIFPLIWMGYSSLKSNEEIILDMFAFPRDLFVNMNDEYVVIPEDAKVRHVRDWDEKKDPRERMVIESTTIAPQKRLLIFFLVKEEMPPEIQALKPGDTLRVSQLPSKYRIKINIDTMTYNYRKSWLTGKLGIGFVNSLIYSIGATFFILLFGLMTSYAVSKMKFEKLSKMVVGAIGLGYLLSLEAVIIPLFVMLNSMSLVDSRVGIIIVYIAFGLPLAVLLASQFMRGLPDSLIESAEMDGASAFRTFSAIIVPMSTPVIVTISIISALGIWNEFMLVLVLASSEATKSLPVGVFSFASLTGTQYGWQLASLVIATLPVIVVYILFQKQLAEGVVAGAIKE